MRALDGLKIVLMLLKVIYKQALAHRGGREGEVSSGLQSAIRTVESVIALGHEELGSTNLSFLDV